MRLAIPVLALCLLATPAFAARHEKVTIHLKTTGDQDAGTAAFEEESNGKLKVTLSLKNIPPGPHGVHIHKVPACDLPDFKTAGPHFNPDASKMHGFENPMGHHAGDMPKNLTPDANHEVHTSFTIDYLSLGTGQPNDILANGGTSIILHAGADDMKTDPSGNSGARIACGIITDVKMPHAPETAPPAPDGPVKPQ